MFSKLFYNRLVWLIISILLVIGAKNISFGETLYLNNKDNMYKKTTFIIKIKDNNPIYIYDIYNKVQKVYFHKMIQKKDIDIDINHEERVITFHNVNIDETYTKLDIRTQRLELSTNERTFSVSKHNIVDGIGKQKFGIRKVNQFKFIVDRDGYFIVKRTIE